MPPIQRKPFQARSLADILKEQDRKEALRKAPPKTPAQKAAAENLLANLGAIIPSRAPRIFAGRGPNRGRAVLEIGGKTYTIPEAIQQVEAQNIDPAAKKAILEELRKLQDIEKTMQQLPPVEGGRIASFEEARRIAEARRSDNPNVTDAPGKRKWYIKKALEDEEKYRQRAPNTPARRFLKDLGGSPSTASAVDELVAPAASSLIKKATDVIESLGKQSITSAQAAKKISKIFSQADLFVNQKALSKEVADRIRNRTIETLKRMPDGDEIINQMQIGETRARLSKREIEFIRNNPESNEAKKLLKSLERRVPPRMYQTATGELREATKPGPLERATDAVRGVFGNRNQNPVDAAAEREAEAISSAGRSRGKKLSVLQRLKQLVESRAPAPRGASPATRPVRSRPYQPSSSKPTDPLPLRSEVREMVPPTPSGPAVEARRPEATKVASSGVRELAFLESLAAAIQGGRMPSKPLPKTSRKKRASKHSQSALDREEFELPGRPEPGPARGDIEPPVSISTLVRLLKPNASRVELARIERIFKDRLAGESPLTGLGRSISAARREVQGEGTTELAPLAPASQPKSQLRELFDYLVKFGPGRGKTGEAKNQYIQNLIAELQR